MKKLHFLLLALLCLSPHFASGVDLIELTEQPRYCSSMDQTIDYMFDMNDHMTVDGLYGFSVARTYEIAHMGDSAHYAFFQAGWFRGTESVTPSDSIFRYHFAQEVVPFYFGYRYEMQLSEHWEAYVGGLIGYVHSKDEKKQTSPVQDYYWKYAITSSTLAGGAIVGICYKITPRVELFAGYTATLYSSLRRQTCDPQISDKHSALSGTASLGLTLKF